MDYEWDKNNVEIKIIGENLMMLILKIYIISSLN